MGKSLYCYLNDQDAAEIYTLLTQNGATVSSKQLGTLQALPAMNESLDIGFGGEASIRYAACSGIPNPLQPAAFMLNNEDDKELSKLFTIIKKFIRKTYRMSDVKLYVGPSMYEDWLKGTYPFAARLWFSSFLVEKCNIDPLFEELLQSGYCIKTEKSTVEMADVLDFSIGQFVVFDPSSRIQTYTYPTAYFNFATRTAVREKRISYSGLSDCVSVSYNDRKKAYNFILDGRVKDLPGAKAPALYEMIKSKWSIDNRQINSQRLEK